MSAASELPDGVERCPTCGRFVSLADGYGDIEPGGIRGCDYIVPYCDSTCAASVECAHGHRGDAPGDCAECPA